MGRGGVVKAVAAVSAIAIVMLVGAVPALAQTTLNFRAHINEPQGTRTHPPDCQPNEGCGTGSVAGIGAVTEHVLFGACGEGCGIQTITFADGSTLICDEIQGSGTVPGKSDHQPYFSYGNPGDTHLEDVVVGGTGEFAGASGPLFGDAHVAGSMAVINLEGPITLGAG